MSKVSAILLGSNDTYILLTTHYYSSVIAGYLSALFTLQNALSIKLSECKCALYTKEPFLDTSVAGTLVAPGIRCTLPINYKLHFVHVVLSFLEKHFPIGVANIIETP